MSGPVIALAAGGTGGHIFPAEALARTLLARGCRVLLLTDRRGQGFADLPNIDVIHLSGSAVLGHSLLRKAVSSLALLRGAWQARSPLKAAGAKAVVGFGGFASVPPGLAATSLGLPLILHEQNAVLGRANRLLAGRAALLATAFPNVRASDPAKIKRIGNPVRSAVAALREHPYPIPTAEGRLSLLVTGGSQGAKAFDNLVPDALAKLPEALRQRLDLVQQVRAADCAVLAKRYAALGIEATLAPFFQDLPKHLAAAQLLIGRAGASTIFELAMAGRPGLLIPYPNAADNHQRANAEAFAAVGGGWLMQEAVLDAEAISDKLHDLLEAPEQLIEAAKKARAFATPQATDDLAGLTLSVAGIAQTKKKA